MLHLVPWMEQVLAQCVLQQTFIIIIIQDGKEAAEKWSKEKQLKVETEGWKKSAQEHQEYAHQGLLSNCTLLPKGGNP